MIMDIAWRDTVLKVLNKGVKISPRGIETLELQHHRTTVDMRHPVLLNTNRKLSYQFMAAEAYWILSGDNTVAGIEPFNKHISKFSDDGKIFYGAYGPKIKSQLDYVVKALLSDPNTRQAGLTIWRENPEKSKDIPCTVAIWFHLRDNKLQCHVFMRSSDVWLGLPYDVFNFSMLAHQVCGELNYHNHLTKGDFGHANPKIEPGLLHLTAASSHLYKTNYDEVIKCLDIHYSGNAQYTKTPEMLYTHKPTLMGVLRDLRYTKKGDGLRWWSDETN